MTKRAMVEWAAAGCVLASALMMSRVAGAAEIGCDMRTNGLPEKLMECVTLENVRAHQEALQVIANANGDTRVAGSPGYDDSADYVAMQLAKAGYVVTRQEFQFQTFIQLSPSSLEQISPLRGIVPDRIMSYSGSGDVTAIVTALAGPTIDDTPGCDAADFAGFPPGHIALISRGSCAFAIKATNAAAAGATGVIIYNNVEGFIDGTLGNDFTLDIPVTSVTQDAGEELAALAFTPGLVMRLKTDTFGGLATTSNVLAETPTGNDNNVVMAGGHLDSVNAGPGINDNGSGIAALLETAIQMAKAKPNNKVRFAFWGAEESGLVGSEYYVDNLPQRDRDRIALYLNFDMIGSPNHVFFVYDGDDSDQQGAGPGPDGSAAIEDLFELYYSLVGQPFKGTDFSGRSDYGPFIAVGIPAGGLFTGAEGIKTAVDASLWGGTAGEPYDPCYHLACDTYANVNEPALEINADAVAYAVMKFATNTVAVNGIDRKGKGKDKPKALTGLEYWGPRAVR